MKRAGILLLTAALAMATVATAQTVSDGPPPVPSAQDVNTVIDGALVLVGGLLVRPITAILQTWHVTCEVDPKLVAAVLAVIFVGVQGLLSGVYGTGPKAVLFAVVASVLAFARSYGSNRAASIAAAGAQRKTVLAPANANGDVSTQKGLIPTGVDVPSPAVVNHE